MPALNVLQVGRVSGNPSFQFADDSPSEYSSDSDDVEYQTNKDKKTSVTDSDTESENETHVLENALLLLHKTGLQIFHENQTLQV